MENEDLTLTGPCGIYCGACECHTAKDDPKLLAYLISKGIPEEKLPCMGCRKMEGECPVITGRCATYECVKQKNVQFCFECDCFPCEMLNPASDRANVLPHNLKVFNLCMIERHGLEALVKYYPDIKKKYYTGKMVVGKGPQTE